MNRSRSHLARLLQMLAPAALCMLLMPAQAQQYRQFKDWVVGCDNRRTCTVLGLPPQDAGEQAAFVRLLREGAANAAPSLELVYVSENPMEGVALKLLVDGQPLPGLAPLLLAKGDGYTVRTPLAGTEAAAFIAALRTAKRMTLQLFEREKVAGEARDISLAGSAAALLFADAQQQRDGGATAIVAKGPKPASAVPPVPALTSLVSLTIEELDQPLPPMPPEVAHANGPSCGNEQPLAIRLGTDATLWGLCDEAGAYNFGFRMLVEQRGTVHAQKFSLPGGKGGPADAVLVNPGVMEDRRTLNAFNKGRGPGDCGDSSDWVWDGATFRLLRYSTLWACRGVPSDDWPQLYIAQRR